MTTAAQTSDRHISETGYDITPLSEEERERLAKGLDDEQYRILMNHGTEPAFCGNLTDHKEAGTYACRLCGLPLFKSDAKFYSGTGWPSFFIPFDKEHLKYIDDNSYGMRRTEIRCARCDGHQPAHQKRSAGRTEEVVERDAGQRIQRLTAARRRRAMASGRLDDVLCPLQHERTQEAASVAFGGEIAHDGDVGGA